VVLGDWAAVETSPEAVVQELLRTEAAPNPKSEAKV
jgi:hypothetical protein